MKENKKLGTRGKEDALLSRALKDRAFAKIVHKALKKRFKKWVKIGRDLCLEKDESTIQIEYSVIDWTHHPLAILLIGTHFERFYALKHTEFLGRGSPASQGNRLRGMVEVKVTDRRGRPHVGRAFCMWDDPFDPLIGTLLAEHRLLRVMGKRGFTI